MRGIIGVMLVLVITGGMVKSQTTYENRILLERVKTDSIFSDTAASILPKSEVKHFEGLHYFPVDSNYKVEAKFFKQVGKSFEMQTSTSRKPIYRQYGYLKFTVSGERGKLYLYQQVKSMENDTPVNAYLFCPFRDLTNKDSSYGGGRYLDFKLSELEDKSVIVDFNMCYNPYCAYNNRYSCPVPPIENTLKFRIEAGVKKWHD